MWMQDVVLIVYAMSLHRITIYDQRRKSFVGLVDEGTAIPEAEETEALVFMIVGLTCNWKHIQLVMFYMTNVPQMFKHSLLMTV